MIELSNILMPIVVSLVSTGILIVLVVLINKLQLQNEGENLPLAVQIEIALEPIVLSAIVAAYKLSEEALDTFQQRLSGVQKKEFADMLYDAMPNMIGPFPVTVVRAIVTKDRFSELVQDAFNSANILIDNAQVVYADKFHAWLAEASKE